MASRAGGRVFSATKGTPDGKGDYRLGFRRDRHNSSKASSGYPKALNTKNIKSTLGHLFGSTPFSNNNPKPPPAILHRQPQRTHPLPIFQRDTRPPSNQHPLCIHLRTLDRAMQRRAPRRVQCVHLCALIQQQLQNRRLPVGEDTKASRRRGLAGEQGLVIACDLVFVTWSCLRSFPFSSKPPRTVSGSTATGACINPERHGYYWPRMCIPVDAQLT